MNRKTRNKQRQAHLGLSYVTGCVRAGCHQRRIMMLFFCQCAEHSYPTALSVLTRQQPLFLKVSLPLPLFLYHSLALSHPLTCPLHTFTPLPSLFLSLSLPSLGAPPPTPSSYPPPCLSCFHTHHVYVSAMWLTSLSLASAVCALYGEEDAVVRLLGRPWHPLLCGSRHRPAHLPSLPGKIFSVTLLE